LSSSLLNFSKAGFVDVVILELEGVEWPVAAERLLDMVGKWKREEGKRATHG
jgi:hypothetical protein